MTNKQKNYGRTLYDVIAEYPKTTFFVILLLLLLVIALIFLKIPFKAGNFEFGERKEQKHDTLTKHDTIFVTKYITVRKSNEKADTQTTISVKSYNQKGGQTANQITNNN
jgi:predicted RND superfamily exporter protein